MALYTAESDVVAFGLEVFSVRIIYMLKKRKIVGVLDTCV